MATDADTFKFTLNLYSDYYKSGGEVSGMFLDGSKGVMNPQSNDWFCVNVQGPCPATMPWRSGSRNDPKARNRGGSIERRLAASGRHGRMGRLLARPSRRST